MEIRQFQISGLVEFRPRLFSDERGLFFESHNTRLFSELKTPVQFVQDNQSYSHKDVLRGLHYQQGEAAQGKLVRVLSGKVMDVAVDMRQDSPTYLQHQKVELNSTLNNMLWIPRGFAHGFLALENSVLFYKCDNYYNKAEESGIRWDDTTLNIDWGINSPLISTKDAALSGVNNVSKL
jgi:dTDP-4-dehydrorhamnose 3,5-epimerase